MRNAWLVLALASGGCVIHDAGPGQAPPGPPLTRAEAERLAAAGLSEAFLVELVETRGARALTADDLVALKAAGASDTVIQKMIAAETKVPEVVVVQEPAYYYGYPGYYWGPSWGFSFGYGYTYSHHHHYSRPSTGYRGVR